MRNPIPWILGTLVVLALLVPETVAKKGGNKPGGGGGGGGGGDEPPADPAIVYNDDGDLVVMNADGSNRTVVLAAAGDLQMAPAWSPDGTRLAFNGTDGLYVVDLDGTNLARIHEGFVRQPAWSPAPAPDGAFKIAFWSAEDGQGPDLFLVNPDGCGLLNLTATEGSSEFDPAWSPDATRLAARVNYVPNESVVVFTIALDGAGALAVVDELDLTDVAGSPLQAIGAEPNNAFHWMDWARTADRVAFSVYAGDNWDLWYVDLADRANPVQVTSSGRHNERHPSWSPDDGRLACWKRRTARGDIVTMNPDGSGQTELASGEVRFPDWRR